MYIKDILKYEIYSTLPLNKTAQIHHTVQICTARCTTKCTTKCTTCCTIKSIEELNFLCVLVLLNRRKIKFTSTIGYSSY